MNELFVQLQRSLNGCADQLWTASWQGGIALAAVWAITRPRSFISPRVKCWIWRAAYLKLLVALVWIEPLSLPLLTTEEPSSSIPAIAVGMTSGPPTAASASPSPMHLATASSRSAPRIAIDNSSVHIVSVPALIVALWLIGIGISVYVTFRLWILSRRLLATSVASIDSHFLSAMREQAFRLGVRRLPELRLAPHLASPALMGIVRPAILLPDDAMARFNPTELRILLAHELAHLKRVDLAWNWLLVTTRAVFFFHPLVWVSARSWSEAQESACDELLIRDKTAAASDIGRLLLKVSASSPRGRPTGFGAALMLGNYRNLKRRIAIMAELRPSSTKRAWVAGSLLAVFVVTGIIPWQLTGSEADDVPPSVPKSNVGRKSIEPAVVAALNESITAKVNALTHARLKLRVVELASGDHYLLKMNPDTSRKWHPLLRKTSDEVNAILDSVDLTTEPRGLHTITQQLVAGRLIEDSQAYEVVNIVTDGAKYRETWERGGSAFYDGDAGVVLDPANRQARISRHFPAMTLRWLDTGPVVLQTLEALESQPARGRYELNSDGTVRRWVSFALPNDTWAQQTRYGYKQYSDSVAFPTVQISASYDASNILYRLLIIVIEDAEFDPDLPTDAFRVAVPANTAVWDERGTPHLRAVTEPVEDLLKFVRDSTP